MQLMVYTQRVLVIISSNNWGVQGISSRFLNRRLNWISSEVEFSQSYTLTAKDILYCGQMSQFCWQAKLHMTRIYSKCSSSLSLTHSEKKDIIEALVELIVGKLIKYAFIIYN